jgi:hypothetical protein
MHAGFVLFCITLGQNAWKMSVWTSIFPEKRYFTQIWYVFRLLEDKKLLTFKWPWGALEVSNLHLSYIWRHFEASDSWVIKNLCRLTFSHRFLVSVTKNREVIAQIYCIHVNRSIINKVIALSKIKSGHFEFSNFEFKMAAPMIKSKMAAAKLLNWNNFANIRTIYMNFF